MHTIALRPRTLAILVTACVSLSTVAVAAPPTTAAGCRIALAKVLAKTYATATKCAMKEDLTAKPRAACAQSQETKCEAVVNADASGCEAPLANYPNGTMACPPKVSEAFSDYDAFN